MNRKDKKAIKNTCKMLYWVSINKNTPFSL